MKSTDLESTPLILFLFVSKQVNKLLKREDYLLLFTLPHRAKCPIKTAITAVRCRSKRKYTISKSGQYAEVLNYSMTAYRESNLLCLLKFIYNCDKHSVANKLASLILPSWIIS